jgi:hypothetical protein
MSRKPGAKTQAVRQALNANPEKLPKEIAEILTAEGLQVSANYVSTIKSKLKMKGKRKQKAAAPVPAACIDVAADAISIGLLRKAKKLAQELGGIKAAQTAIHALAQILD